MNISTSTERLDRGRREGAWTRGETLALLQLIAMLLIPALPYLAHQLTSICEYDSVFKIVRLFLSF